MGQTRSDGRRTRERVLAVAIPLFAKHGFAGTSIRMVSTAAEVNVATLAYHFQDKEGLYTSVVTRLHEDLQAAFPNEMLQGSDPNVILHQVVAGIWAFCKEHREHNRLLMRHGLNPHLGNLLAKGQTHLGNVVTAGNNLSLINNAPDAVVRAYVRASTGTNYNAAAIDDDGVTTFDTLNMRNQAQTQQVEFTVTNGASFELGFETGPTLNNSTDGDALPDSWEAANNLHFGDGTGVNGDSGNPDQDSFSNLEEFILGLNPRASSTYSPVVERVPAGFTLSFPTLPGRFYKVFYTDDLGAWNPASGDLTGTGGSLVWTDDGSMTTPPPTGLTKRFYKVEVRLINP